MFLRSGQRNSRRRRARSPRISAWSRRCPRWASRCPWAAPFGPHGVAGPRRQRRVPQAGGRDRRTTRCRLGDSSASARSVVPPRHRALERRSPVPGRPPSRPASSNRRRERREDQRGSPTSRNVSAISLMRGHSHLASPRPPGQRSSESRTRGANARSMARLFAATTSTQRCSTVTRARSSSSAQWLQRRTG